MMAYLLELSEFFLFGHYLPCTHDALLDCNNVKFRAHVFALQHIFSTGKNLVETEHTIGDPYPGMNHMNLKYNVKNLQVKVS